MAEYIEREALLERIDDIWDCADLVFEPNDHCCRADDCASCKWAETKNAIRKIIANFPAADAIEELTAYVRQIEELRKDGYYLQKTKMMTYGQATMTMPLPEPPKEEAT